MELDRKIKAHLDKLWANFLNSGMSAGMTIMDQITYLLYLRYLSQIDGKLWQAYNSGKIPNRPHEIFTPEFHECNWFTFSHLSPTRLFKVLREKVIPFVEQLDNSVDPFIKTFKQIEFQIQNPSLLKQTVSGIDALYESIKEASATDDQYQDLQGRTYEYLLSLMSRPNVPRVVIEMLVKIVKPRSRMKVCSVLFDTSEFLIETIRYIRKSEQGNTSAVYKAALKGRNVYGYPSDLISFSYSYMNFLLHGISEPQIREKNEVESAKKPKFDLVFSDEMQFIRDEFINDLKENCFAVVFVNRVVYTQRIINLQFLNKNFEIQGVLVLPNLWVLIVKKRKPDTGPFAHLIACRFYEVTDREIVHHSSDELLKKWIQTKPTNDWKEIQRRIALPPQPLEFTEAKPSVPVEDPQSELEINHMFYEKLSKRQKELYGIFEDAKKKGEGPLAIHIAAKRAQVGVQEAKQTIELLVQFGLLERTLDPLLPQGLPENLARQLHNAHLTIDRYQLMGGKVKQ